MNQPRIIGRSTPDRPAMTLLLERLGLGDQMTPEERDAALERGEIWDTDAGRAFMRVIRSLPKTRPSRAVRRRIERSLRRA